ncbi:hypothetical protein Cgig2_000959 [Carnegiea gigantea]|uniref:Uncharacterized protein n=1 Tax=Carnegiea gigantea TaxID=171969 RepID=A0A9Q1KMZ6_9CARY|nr:hypothetical protein Cgig2_000959 [Carnegiea gigantea]
MDAVAEGLWGLADYHEQKGEIAKALKCLEAVCQSQVSFLPIIEQLLLKSIPSCLELKCRAYSLLGQCYHLVGAIPNQKQILNKGLELTQSLGDRFVANLWYSNFSAQLSNALIIEGDYQNSLVTLQNGYDAATEICYPELQMFFATSMLHVHLMQWDDVNLMERALVKCDEVWESFDLNKRQQCLGLLFYNELLHVFYRLRICDYKNVAQHIDRLDAAMKADTQQVERVQELTNELNALNQSLRQPDMNYGDRQVLSKKRAQIEQQLRHISASSPIGQAMDSSYIGHQKKPCADRLELAPFPIDGDWLPKSAVYALVDLTVVIFGRPKGLFKECGRRIQTGIQTIQGQLFEVYSVLQMAIFYVVDVAAAVLWTFCHSELLRLGITDVVRGKASVTENFALIRTEVDLQHSAIWTAGVYLMLLMQFLENKIAVDLTRADFVEAQEAHLARGKGAAFVAPHRRSWALAQMRDWYVRFPTILQACECIIEMLRGQYAHSVGCFSEAVFHFAEATKVSAYLFVTIYLFTW